MCEHIVYRRRLPTGLGDRMLILIGAASLASFNKTCVVLHYKWINDANNRYYDAKEVETKLSLPFPLSLSRPPFVSERWDESVWGTGRLTPTSGYDCVPELLPFTYRSAVMRKGFLEHYRAVASQVMPSVRLRQGYVAVHIRGTDKRITYAHCLSHVLRQLVVPVKIVSDDPKLAYEATKQRTVTSADVYSDLAVLLGASGIVMHSPGGWSAFSAMASFFRSVPTITTATDTWQLELFRNAGASLPGWYTCDEVSKFASAVRPLVNRSGHSLVA